VSSGRVGNRDVKPDYRAKKFGGAKKGRKKMQEKRRRGNAILHPKSKKQFERRSGRKQKRGKKNDRIEEKGKPSGRKD